MIKCDKENISIRGSKALVLAELSTLVNSLCYSVLIDDRKMNPEEAKAEILEAVERGFMTEDEAKAKVSELMSEGFDDMIGTLLEKFLKGLGDD